MNKLSIETLFSIESQFSHLESSPILNNDKIVGYHVNSISNHNSALGSGCSSIEKTAKLIAISETLERKLFRKFKSETPSDFLLSEHPSSCGFAFGFDDKLVAQRAIYESIERWAWSKWIDDKIPLQEMSNHDLNLTPLAEVYNKNFDEIKLFLQPIEARLNGKKFNLNLAVVLAFKNGGIFPGSKLGRLNENLWEHALAECWRHLIISNSVQTDSPIVRRIKFFSKNKDSAIRQIPVAFKEFPKPSLRFLKIIRIAKAHAFFGRAVCDDYVGWHVGDETRFVY